MYIPESEDAYFKYAFQVFQKSIYSLLETIDTEKTNITIVNNDCKQEVTDYLTDLLAQKKIDRHIHCQENYGKVYTVIQEARGCYEEYIAIVDSDVYFFEGWQTEVLNVIKALEEIKEDLQQFSVVVFGAHKVVEDYVKNNNLPFKVFDKNGLKHEEVLKLMGKSIVYIGNSISDGMPNTLLEAMIMGAFPIQSNPGGNTSEIIEENVNGFLIHNPENIQEIKKLILKAIQNRAWLESVSLENYNIAEEYVDLNTNRQKILALYQQIKKDTCE